MNQGSTVFAQVLDFLPKRQFRRCVARYQGNHRVRSFTCSDQFLCMAFAQLTYRDSLRDIECCLRAMKDKLYHMGIRGKISRSTLADANEKRDWRIYRDFAQILIRHARKLYVMKTLAFSSMKPFMPWMRLLSIYAYRCSHGPNFANPRGRSNYIHY